mgnify:CR=1 FL=1|tara:strand:- start:196 stop:759 length:564 start_codon:yes stop_codon:yes gene_type:complete
MTPLHFLLILLPATSALRVPPPVRPLESRRTALATTAAALLSTVPAATRAEESAGKKFVAETFSKKATTLQGTAIELDAETPAESRNKGDAADLTPAIAAGSFGVALSRVEFTVPHTQTADDSIEIMWLKKFAPNAAKGFYIVYSVGRIAPGSPARLEATLPKGTKAVPMHWGPKTGLWEGAPFVVP